MGRLSESLREAIEEQIAMGQLAPGTRLDELAMAARFGVSRTPIREAFSLLVGEGLLQSRCRGGATVTYASPQRLIEMFEVMAELEAMCTRLAVRRMTAADAAAIDTAHEQCRAAALANDTDAYYYANERFHQTLYAASHNGFLVEQATALQRRLRPYRRLQLRVRNRVQRSFDEHEVIVANLKAGDSEKLAASVRAHITVQGERFADLIASLSEMTG